MLRTLEQKSIMGCALRCHAPNSSRAFSKPDAWRVALPVALGWLTLEKWGESMEKHMEKPWQKP
jgi:hypothetical protein